MRKQTPATIIERDGAGGNKETVESHESYGMINFSRCQGGQANLFGSSIQHNEKVRMEVKRCKKHRHLNRDWFHGEEEIVEIEMSPSQFAEAITSMNMGQGVPVTLVYVAREPMAECPEANQRQTFEKEFETDVKEVSEFMLKIEAEVKDILGKKSILKSDREKILGMVDKLIRETRSNLPFVQSQFNEAMDKTVVEAKAEVEAAVLHAVVTAGLDAIAGGDAKELIGKQFPQLGDGR